MIVVIVLERVPASLRGDLSRWMLEPHPGTFVGQLTPLVRDLLWERVRNRLKNGAALLVHPDTTEQGFVLDTANSMTRTVIDFDGLQLVRDR